MFNVFEKIMIGLLIFCLIILFTCYGVIIYKAATGDESFFVRKVYIMNCKEAK